MRRYNDTKLNCGRLLCSRKSVKEDRCLLLLSSLRRHNRETEGHVWRAENSRKARHTAFRLSAGSIRTSVSRHFLHVGACFFRCGGFAEKTVERHEVRPTNGSGRMGARFRVRHVNWIGNRLELRRKRLKGLGAAGVGPSCVNSSILKPRPALLHVFYEL